MHRNSVVGPLVQQHEWGMRQNHIAWYVQPQSATPYFCALARSVKSHQQFFQLLGQQAKDNPDNLSIAVNLASVKLLPVIPFSSVHAIPY